MSLRWVSFRSVLLILFGVLFIVGCREGATSRRVSAPNFVLNNLNGRTVQLTDLQGKVVIVDFWASWCGPCLAEMPHFADLYREYRERGLELVGVAIASPLTEIKKVVQDLSIPYTIVLGDDQIVQSYASLEGLPTTMPGSSAILSHPGGLNGIPTTFVIDREGKIYRKYEGYRDRETFERDIQSLL